MIQRTFFQKLFLQIQILFVLLHQHTHPASHKNSALRVSVLFFIIMAKSPYSKSFIPYPDQIALLKSRGMSFADENKALHLLENISYYRFSGYWYPLLADKQNHVFKPDADFETAFNLYRFDGTETAHQFRNRENRGCRPCQNDVCHVIGI
jgi:hypothetical protein